MYNRKELLEQLEERFKNQSEIINKNPNDMTAYQHLSDVRQHIIGVRQTHIESPKDKFVVFENIDYRSLGDDHSEISKIPIFKCCMSCCRALQFWLKDQQGYDRNGIYHSIGEYKNEELNKKIVISPARTLSESMDSDEMRVNSEGLD